MLAYPSCFPCHSTHLHIIFLLPLSGKEQYKRFLTDKQNAANWCDVKCLLSQQKAFTEPPEQLAMQLTNK